MESGFEGSAGGQHVWVLVALFLFSGSPILTLKLI